MINLLISLKNYKKKMKDNPNLLMEYIKKLLFEKHIEYFPTKDKEDGVLKVINFILLLSYTERNNNVINSLQDKILEDKKFKDIEISDKTGNIWSWVKKNNYLQILEKINNLSNYTDKDPKYNTNMRYNFDSIIDELIIDDEFENNIIFTKKFNELKILSERFKLEDLKLLKKRFNIHFDIFYNMYKQDILPINVRSNNKNFNEMKRELFIKINIKLFTNVISKLLNTSNLQQNKKFLGKYIFILRMYLSKESKFLKREYIKPVQKEPQIEEENNKDELLNDFFNEEDEEDLEEINEEDIYEEEDNEDEEEIVEDYGEDIDDLF
jgi:hypothetical protein